MSRYKHWMGLSFEGGEAPLWAPHCKCFIPRALHQRLMSFRLCSWPLQVNKPYAYGTVVPRSDRFCPSCNLQLVEDERHVLLECPRYADDREEFGYSTVCSDSDMCTIMRDVDMQLSLARLLDKIWRKRHALVPMQW